MRRTAWMVTCILGFYALISADLAPKKAPTDSHPAWTVSTPSARARARKRRTRKIRVSRCVKYSQTHYQRSLDMHLDNRCGARLSCKLRWKLRCTPPKGKSTVHKADRLLDLDKANAKTVGVSAKTCGTHAWKVVGVRWHCDVSDS